MGENREIYTNWLGQISPLHRSAVLIIVNDRRFGAWKGCIVEFLVEREGGREGGGGLGTTGGEPLRVVRLLVTT